MIDLTKLKRSSKKDDVPGTVESSLDELCPVCGRKLRRYKPCCGSPTGYDGCNACGYKVNRVGGSD